MRVIGLEAAVGSLLYPFQEAGHEIVASYDSRNIGNHENFSLNFPDTEYLEKPEDTIGYKDIDVVMCQPSCSKFSALSRKDACDYDEGIDLAYYLDKIRPKYFFIESKLDYLSEIPTVDGYKYHFEWVSNHHYGNVQRTRNRLWVMAVREDMDWTFMSNEQQHSHTVESVLKPYGLLDIDAIDHTHIYKPFLSDSAKGEYLSLDEAFDMLQRDGKLTYLAADGQIKTRINRKMIGKVTCTTITGGGTWFHWEKKYPLTLREKAAIQGFPDSFSFKGLSSTRKDKAVGKSMPLQFTRELVRQLDGEQPEKRSKVVPTPVKLLMHRRKFYG